MEKTTIYLPIALKNEIRVLARSSKRSEAETIRHALSQYVEQTRTERPIPKSLGMISNGSFDAADYETQVAESLKPDW